MTMYELTIGIHRGTLMSRDVEQSESFKSMDDCIKAVAIAKEWYKNIGYNIWFANVKKPDGTKTTLEQNTNYN
jgi:hypothetical protein